MSAGRVFIAEQVIAMLWHSAADAKPLETGGVLVGVLRDDEPWITSAFEVIDVGRTSASFVIPAGVTPMAVEAAQDYDGRVGFIGMWHSHPANVPASPTDKATLRREASRRGRTKNVPAIMIVVRDTEAGWCLDAVRDTGKGPQPVEIVLTGPIGQEGPDDAR